jgi:aspartyl-tRNA synthetase
MMLLGQESIRDVLLFPQMKPKLKVQPPSEENDGSKSDTAEAPSSNEASES